MKKRTYRLSDETVTSIQAIKESLNLNSDKEVIEKAIEQFALSKMIGSQSSENEVYDLIKMISDKVDSIHQKANDIDHNVSISNMFNVADFQLKQSPTEIIDRNLFESKYYKDAKQEVTKYIRIMDGNNRISHNNNDSNEDKDHNLFDY